MLLWVLATGCAARVHTPDPAPAPLGHDLPAYRAPAASAPAAPEPMPDDPTGTITLRDALALALLHNPGLQAASFDVRASEAERLQAGLLPNPVLDTESEDLAGSGAFIPEVSQPQTTIRLSQLVELGGDRAARRRLAGAMAALAGWDYEAHRLDVLTDTAQAFTTVLGAQAALRLATDDVRNAERVASTVSERVAAGVVSPVEETRAHVAVAAARIEAETARQSLDAARRTLSLAWGSDTPRFTDAAGSLPPITPIPPAAALFARRSHNPDLARWDVELARREADAALERARAIPDVTLSAGYRRFHDTESNAMVVGLSVPLPIFDRNQGATDAAGYRLAAGGRARRAAEDRVGAALAEAYRTLSAAHAEARLLETEVLPGSERAYAATQEGYQLGKFSLLEVLDVQRVLFVARLRHVQALTRFHTAVAEVERLVGEPLDGAGGPE